MALFIYKERISSRRRAWLSAAIAWLPIVVLTIARSGASGAATVDLWRDVALHARFLVCVPLLIVARSVVLPRLGAIARHFTEAGIVSDEDAPAFERAIDRTREHMESPTRRVIAVAIAYAIMFGAMIERSHEQLPDWQIASRTTWTYSPAGWWNALVGLPILLSLAIAWFWRVAAWAALLRRVARLELRLVASHPDHAAGIGFVGNSLRAFAPVGLALTTLTAAQSAQFVLRGLGPPTPYVYFNAGFLIVLAIVFMAPLFAFVPKLMRVWWRASFEYGALAHRAGQVFESRWLADNPRDEKVLGTGDFSATTDLYQVVSNVYAMRLVPIGLRDLFVLGSAMLIPFIPVLLLTVPLSVIWDGIKGILF